MVKEKECNGYSYCKNIPCCDVMFGDVKLYSWCLSCLKRYKEEYPKLHIEIRVVLPS